jgi:virginiamycin B lyase
MTLVHSAAVKRAAIFMALLGLCAGLSGRITAAIVEFPIPNAGAQPEGITLGPDGAFWYAGFGANFIGRVDTNGVFSGYGIPPSNSRPFGIASAGDGSNLWFTEASYNAVGRINTNGTIQQFALPFNVVGTGMTLGPDGRIWLLDFGAENFIPGMKTNGGVVALTLSNAVISHVDYYNSNITLNSRPVSITTGPDGNLYFTEQLAGKIGRITTAGVITEATINPTNTQPIDITTGPDGALWFTQGATNALGRIDTNLNITQFLLPTNNTGGAVLDEPNGITLGKDGNLYYTDSPAGIIGQVAVSGTNISVNQFYTPTTNAGPWRIAAAPNGNIWFVEFVLNNIGEFVQPVPLSVQLSSNLVVLSWTTNVGAAFTLQENAGLNPTNWVPVPTVPVVNTNTGKFTVSIMPTNGPPTNMLFFRLN